MVTRESHQVPAAADDAPHPAPFSRLGVLDVLPSTTPRPSDRKHHWARRLAALATELGEIFGLAHTSERGTALIFALAALTLIAITIGAVTAELQSRGTGVILEERAVRVTALSDAAMAETLAELAAGGVAFSGVTERPFEGGAISSTVRPLGAWEAEVIAVGRRDDWQAVVTARVWVKDGARVLWWQRTQGPFAPPKQERDLPITHPQESIR